MPLAACQGLDTSIPLLGTDKISFHAYPVITHCRAPLIVSFEPRGAVGHMLPPTGPREIAV